MLNGHGSIDSPIEYERGEDDPVQYDKRLAAKLYDIRKRDLNAWLEPFGIEPMSNWFSESEKLRHYIKLYGSDDPQWQMEMLRQLNRQIEWGQRILELSRSRQGWGAKQTEAIAIGRTERLEGVERDMVVERERVTEQGWRDG